MKLKDYIERLAENPTVLILSYEQSHELCEDISTKEKSDIPEKYHDEIENLLVERLNSKAIEKHLISPLEKLLASLRDDCSNSQEDKK